MEMEARSFAPDKSQQVLGKIRDYKSDLQGLKDSLKGAARAPASSGQSARKDMVRVPTSAAITLLKDTCHIIPRGLERITTPPPLHKETRCCV